MPKNRLWLLIASVAIVSFTFLLQNDQAFASSDFYLVDNAELVAEHPVEPEHGEAMADHAVEAEHHEEGGHHGPDTSPLFFIILAVFIGAATRHFLKKIPVPFTALLLVIGMVLGGYDANELV